MCANRILGILVSYNPNISELIFNIKAIIGQVDLLVVFDNHSHDRLWKNEVENLGNVKVLLADHNYGLGYAFNRVLEQYSSNYDFYVTFDQDTLIPENTISTLVSELKKDQGMGAIGPQFSRNKAFVSAGKVIGKRVLIQSCTVFRTIVFKSVGGFDESLFIDSTDFDYCLRIWLKGYSVKMHTGINICHQLGEQLQIGKRKIIVHNNFRNYYFARNHIKLTKKYFFKFPYFILKKNYFFIKHILITFLIERNHDKIRYIKRGLLNQDYEKI